MADKDFPGAFTALRAILEPYAPEMEVIADTDVEYGLNTHWRRPKDGYPGYFGSAKVGKRYVSYYLMALYTFPELADDLSPELRKRRQGKSCFNFTAVDVVLFDELATLTRHGCDLFAQHGLLENADG
jgi:hypothetical protein